MPEVCGAWVLCTPRDRVLSCHPLGPPAPRRRCRSHHDRHLTVKLPIAAAYTAAWKKD
jgi:hypothetical protein